MESGERIRVEVAYGLPERQRLIEVRVPAAASVEDAISHSGILGEFPEIDLGVHRVGIFGALVRLDDRLRDGDRVEIYRPLIADPKETRRRRAARQTGRRK